MPAPKKPKAAVTPAERRIARVATPEDYRAFQKFFFRAVTRPLVDDATDPVWHDGRAAAPLFGAFVKGDARKDALTRVQVYNRMYWYRTLDSLAEDFPGVRAVLGETRFWATARAYVHKTGSTAFTLRLLGQVFEKWIRGAKSGLPAPVRAAAGDVAAVEWAACVAFEAPALPPLDPAALATPDRLKLILQPHLTLLRLRHDAEAFLKKLPPGEPPARPVKPKTRASFVAISRIHNVVAIHALARGEHALLSAFDGGCTLSAAIMAASSRRDAPNAETLRGWFTLWTERGWLTTPAASQRAAESDTSLDLTAPAKPEKAGERAR